MRLKDFLRAHDLTEAEFGRRADLETSTVHRAANGKVMPSEVTMRRIIAATGGLVQPNDFFDLPVPTSEAAPPRGLGRRRRDRELERAATSER